MCFMVIGDFFFFKQKTAYEMRISDWSSDVRSSDLHMRHHRPCSLRFWGILVVTQERVQPDQLAAALVQALHFGLQPVPGVAVQRSEERRVGKECVSTCRSRWSPYH